MSKLQIASDLHIEFNNNDIPDPSDYITPVSNILVLAGDIGSVYKYSQLEGFLKLLCPKFVIVLYIPGNQEYYNIEGIPHKTMSELYCDIQSISDAIPNLYILDNNKIVIGDVCIAGCTLWSYPLIQIPKYIVRINNINTSRYKNMFKEDLKFVKETIAHCQEKKLRLIMITHHAPTYDVLVSSNKKDRVYSLYASNLDYLLCKENVETWICGHTHRNFDFISPNGTRVVSNQKGKPKDRVTDFRMDFTVNF